MIATVRLNEELERLLERIAIRFHKKKSEVIREAIVHYAQDLEKKQKTRMQRALEKTKESDYKEYKKIEESIDDGL